MKLSVLSEKLVQLVHVTGRHFDLMVWNCELQKTRGTGFWWSRNDDVSAVSHIAGEGAQLTTQHQPLNGLDCSLLITMGIFYEVNYMLFLNWGILENLGYLSKSSSSYCVFLVTSSAICHVSQRRHLSLPGPYCLLDLSKSLELASSGQQGKLRGWGNWCKYWLQNSPILWTCHRRLLLWIYFFQISKISMIIPSSKKQGLLKLGNSCKCNVILAGNQFYKTEDIEIAYLLSSLE